MSYQVSWLLENRIMLISYVGVLTSTELRAYLAETMDLRDRANAALGVGGPLVHTITDARLLTKNDIALKDALKVVETVRKQRVGWTVYIPANKMDLFFASLGHQLAGVRFRHFASIGEGVDFLKEVDDTLVGFNYGGDSTLHQVPNKVTGLPL
jgi:hypothetical protein